MLRYQNGEMTYKNPDYNVEEYPIMSLGELGKTHFIYLPANEYYTIRDLSDDNGIDMTMVNINLSVSVDTDSHEFEIVVSDEQKLAKAILKDAKKDEAYSISIGCVADGERTEYIGTGTADETGGIGLGLNDGNLETPDGNSVGLVSICRS